MSSEWYCLFFNLQMAEEYSEPYNTSKMGRFAKTVNNLYPLTNFEKSSIFVRGITFSSFWFSAPTEGVISALQINGLVSI